MDPDKLLLACRDLVPDLKARDDMRAILTETGVGLVLLAEIQRDVESKKNQLISTDLSHDDGMNRVRALQAEIRGLNRVIDIMLDIANQEEN